MKSSSDQYPNLTVQSAGKTQVNFNIEEVTVTNMDGSTRTAYMYDYVEVEGEVTKEKVIETILLATQVKEPEPLPIIPEPIEEKAVDAKIVEEAILEADVIVKQGVVAISEALKPKPVKEEPIEEIKPVEEPVVEEPK